MTVSPLVSAAQEAERTLADADLAALGKNARLAAEKLATAPTSQKNAALIATASAIRQGQRAILEANEADVAAAKAAGRANAFVDRLLLNPARIEAIAGSLEDIAALPDPCGSVIAEWERPNGLKISRIRVPLGVIGIIYESRPNVTIDAGALCLKSGNAAILRGGSECLRTNSALHACLVRGLEAARLPTGAVQLVATADRRAVSEMLSGLGGTIDVVVPRGGKSLVARVQEEARVPVFAHLEGVCHVYVDAAADIEKARAIVVNAKMRRTGICGAAETLLIDERAPVEWVSTLTGDLIAAGCEVRGDEKMCAANPAVKRATEQDWGTEYLDAIIAARCVSGVDGAIAHIRRYGSQHTDAIVTEDQATAEKFLREVDSAIVLHNASTQFADGGEFGMGAEIGIATGRFHARGPVGLEQLTTFKYVVRGTGQIRPA